MQLKQYISFLKIVYKEVSPKNLANRALAVIEFSSLRNTDKVGGNNEHTTYSFLPFLWMQSKHLQWAFFSKEIKCRCLHITPHPPKALLYVPPLFNLSLHLLYTLSIWEASLPELWIFWLLLPKLIVLPCQETLFLLCGVTVWPHPSKSIFRFTGFMALILFAVCSVF